MDTNTFIEKETLTEVVSDSRVVTLSSARNIEEIKKISQERAGETLLSVFADSSLLFGLRGSLSIDDPCPRCALFHLSSDPETVSVLQEKDGETPSAPSIQKNISQKLVTKAETEKCEPVLIAYDCESDSWFSSAPMHKHPSCSHKGFSCQSTTNPQQITNVSDLESVLLNPHFGILRSVGDVQSTATSASLSQLPNIHTSQSRVINPLFCKYPDQFKRFIEAGGAGRTPKMARIRGLMEGIERFGTLLPRSVERVAAETDLSEPHIPLSSFYLYDESQYSRPDFPYLRYNERTTCEWVVTKKLGTRESVYIPADLVYITSGATNKRFVGGNSNGCAAHLERNEALIAGVMELFERDAITHHWYTQSSKCNIRLSTLPEPHQTHINELESLGYDVHVVDSTRYPPFYCYEVFFLNPNRDDLPTVIPGAASALDTKIAMEKAFQEALDNLTCGAITDIVPLESKNDVERTADHLDFYQLEDRYKIISSTLRSGRKTDFENKSIEATISSVVNAITENNIAVYSKELTPPSLRRHGIHVVRTVSPDLVPITFGYGHERLAHPTKPVSDIRSDGLMHPYP